MIDDGISELTENISKLSIDPTKIILSTKNDSIKPKFSNKGETGEVFVIRKLFELSNGNKKYELIKIFGNNAINGIELCDIETNKKITDINMIKKAKSISKADCMLKFIKTNEYVSISIKCQHGNMPAILNHTPRSAKVFQATGDLNTHLAQLDKLINQINENRKKKLCGEDVHIDKINLDKLFVDCIINVIKYFVFEGSGRGRSKYPCNAILEVFDPNCINTWKFVLCNDDQTKLQYIKSIYNRIILSMRDKGMPKSNEICKPWIFKQIKDDGIIKEKGSLHIRLKKRNLQKVIV